jgi:hypothetical protein
LGSASRWFYAHERRRAHKRIFAFILLALLFLASQCAAQDLDNVTIAGRVMDQNGAVIPGASVTATLAKTSVGRTVVADGDGRFKIIQLEPGIYSVKASCAGFGAEAKTDLTTVAGQNVQLDFTETRGDYG